jgi:hypothetical protein
MLFGSIALYFKLFQLFDVTFPAGHGEYFSSAVISGRRGGSCGGGQHARRFMRQTRGKVHDAGARNGAEAPTRSDAEHSQENPRLFRVYSPCYN